MTVKMPGRFLTGTPGFPSSPHNPNNSGNLNSLSSLHHNDQYGSTSVRISAKDNSTSSPPSISAVSQVRHHPYPRPERHRAYTIGVVEPPRPIINRPDIFHPPTLLVGLRNSDAMISKPGINDYPTVPVRFKHQIFGKISINRK